VLIETAADAAAALETLNIASWSTKLPQRGSETARGLLVSPLHPAARNSRWSVSTFPLATPSAALLFLDHIAIMGRAIVTAPGHDSGEGGPQKRLRLSRMKVTGP
jgi:hypothetical protein